MKLICENLAAAFRASVASAVLVLAAGGCRDTLAPESPADLDLAAPWVEVTPASVRLEDEMLARAADRAEQLYLQRGKSGNRQLVPEAWVNSITTAIYPVGASLGPLSGANYSRLWWTTDDATTPAYFAWGFGGQFVYVHPALRLVVVTVTDWRSVSSDGGAAALAAAVMDIIINDVVAAAN